ncbi:MAG: translocation/assembly module TamB domain-containing protein [Breznakibacter sp.]
MKKVIKYTVRTLLITLASVLLLVLVMLIAVQTPFGKRQIAAIVEKQLNTMMDARLAIGKLEGNFVSHIELKNIVLLVGSDTLARVGEVRLRYGLWALRQKEIRIDELTLVHPYVHLEQLPDSTWNLQHLIKPAPEARDSTPASPFSMSVQVHQFKLLGGTADIMALDSLLPRRVKDLHIELSASYETHRQRVDLTEFRVATIRPDWEVKKLNARIEADDEQLRLTDFGLQTERNALRLEGNYYFDGIRPSVLNLQTSPVVLDEFAAFLPQGFRLKMKPVITLNAVLEDKNLTVGLLVEDSVQSIHIDVSSKYLIDYFSDTTFSASPSYDLAVDLNNVDLRGWTNDPAMHYVLNGVLGVKGEGFDPHTLNAVLEGRLNDVVANGTHIGQMSVRLDYTAGDANGRIDLHGAFGSLYIEPWVRQVLGNHPSYRLNLVTKNLNLETLLGETYTSGVNLVASVEGAGFEPKTLQAKARVAVGPSTVMAFGIDTVHAEMDYVWQNVAIKSFLIETLSAKVLVSGNYDLAGYTDVNLSANIDNAKEIAAFAKLDSLNTKLNMNAHLSGMPGDLMANLSLRLDSTVYQTVHLRSLTMDADATMTGRDIRINANAVARNVGMDGFALDSVTLQASSDTKNYDIRLEAANPDVWARLATSLKLDETIEVALTQLVADYKGYTWNLQPDTAHITIDGDTYAVRNFVLQSAGTDSMQTVTANGTFSLDGEENFLLDIRNFSLPKLADVFMPGQKLGGMFSFRLQMDGTARHPVLTGKFGLTGGTYQDFRFSVFEGNFGYDNGFAAVNVDLVPLDNGSASLSAKLPAEIRIDSAKFDMTGNRHAPVEGKLLIRQIPLSMANVFFPTDGIEGILQSDIVLKGTISRPDFNGNIELAGGKLKVDRYGIDYRQIQAGLIFNNNRIAVDTFNIRSRRGNMFARGDIRFESDLYEGKMDAAGLRVWFDKFNPVDHKQFNMEVSGNVDLKANRDSTRFSGDLTIPEAMVFIPAVLNLMGQSMETDLPLPLLAAQLQKDSLVRDSMVYHLRPDTVAQLPEKGMSLAFLDNLQGKLNLKIPRNTWVKSDDMRFELGGDLQLIKHEDFFELFGTINVLRGQYSLLGKVFVIKSGEITFEGGEEMNPQLAVEATYSFRDAERVRRELVLKVGGNLSVPEISFYYQDGQISEGDALSYILFGTSLELLGASQQESLSSSGVDATGIAKMAAASLISSQLTKLLGHTMNMDYIEFKSSGSFDNASFVVGKYITNKLFVSYEQNIGKVEDKDASRYEMRMEYELFRFLFFQLTSSSLSNGFDFIFKFDEKQE